MHVDGAYGGAALPAASVRPLFDGIEHADSFVVDPHKWFFAPFDCCALLYRDPALARPCTRSPRATSTSDRRRRSGTRQTTRSPDPPRPRPAVLVLARGARHRAYCEAIETTLAVARYAATQCAAALRRARARAGPVRGGVPPPRLEGRRYAEGSRRLLAAHVAFVTPTVHEGETVTRFAIVNPRTTRADVSMILDTMA